MSRDLLDELEKSINRARAARQGREGLTSVGDQSELDQLRADHKDLQNEADGMADINGRLSGEVILLQDAVWSNGRPWIGSLRAEVCKFCFARMPYGTSEADQQQHYPHKCGCAWFAEDRRRMAADSSMKTQRQL